MTIEIQCSSCQSLLGPKDELAGKQLTCPTCGQLVLVPLAEESGSELLPSIDDASGLMGDGELFDDLGMPDDDPLKISDENPLAMPGAVRESDASQPGAPDEPRPASAATSLMQKVQQTIQLLPKTWLIAIASGAVLGLLVTIAAAVMFLRFGKGAVTAVDASAERSAATRAQSLDGLAGKFRMRLDAEWVGIEGTAPQDSFETDGTPLDATNSGGRWTVRFLGKDWTGNSKELASLKLSVPLAQVQDTIPLRNALAMAEKGSLTLAAEGGQWKVEVTGAPIFRAGSTIVLPESGEQPELPPDAEIFWEEEFDVEYDAGGLRGRTAGKRRMSGPGAARSSPGVGHHTVRRCASIPPLPGYRTLQVTLLNDAHGPAAGSIVTGKDLLPGETCRLVGHQVPITSLEPYDGGRALISIDITGIVRRWTLDSDAAPEVLRIPELRASPSCPAFLRVLADGKTVLTAGGRGERVVLRQWTLDGSTTERQLPIEPLLRQMSIQVQPGRDRFARWHAEFEGLAVSRDGKRAMTAMRVDPDWEIVMIWDLATYKPLPAGWQTRGVRDEVFLGADSLRGLRHGTLHDFSTGRDMNLSGDRMPAAQYVGGRDAVSALAFSPRSSVVAVASDDSILVLGDPGNGMQTGRLIGHSHPVTSLAFSPDGTLLLSASSDGTTRLWDIATGQEMRRFRWGNPPAPVPAESTADAPSGSESVTQAKPFEPSPICVALSPDGRRGFSSESDGTIHVWDLQINHPQVEILPAVQPLAVDTPHADEGVRAESPDGNLAVVAVKGPTPGGTGFEVWDCRQNQRVRTLPDPRNNIGAIPSPRGLLTVAFSPDGKQLATSDGDLWLWDMETPQPLRGLTGSALSLELFASAEATADVGMPENEPYLGVPGLGYQDGARSSPSPFTSLAFTADGRSILCGGLAVCLLDVNNLHLVRQFPQVTDFICLSRDGRRLLGVCVARKPEGQTNAAPDLSVFDASNATELCRMPWMTHAMFSPQGRYLLGITQPSETAPGEVRLVDTNTGQLVRRFPHRPAAVTPVPSGGRSPGMGMADGVLPYSPPNETSYPLSFTCLGISADGRFIVAGSWQKKVVVFDVESGCRLAERGPFRDFIHSVQFEPNGHSIRLHTDTQIPSPATRWHTEPQLAYRSISPTGDVEPRRSAYLLEWPDREAMMRNAEPLADAQPLVDGGLAKVDLSSESDKADETVKEVPDKVARVGEVLTEVRSNSVADLVAAAMPSGTPVTGGHLGADGRGNPSDMLSSPPGDPAFGVPETYAQNGRVNLSDLRSWATLPCSVSPLPDGRHAVVLAPGFPAFLVDLTATEKPRVVGNRVDWHWSDGEEILAVDSQNGAVDKFELASGRLLGRVKLREANPAQYGQIVGMPGQIGCCAFAPSGQWMVVGTSAQELYVAQLRRFEPVKKVTQDNDTNKARRGVAEKKPDVKIVLPVARVGNLACPITGVAVLPDNHSILVAGGDGSVQVWDAAGQKQLRSFEVLHQAAQVRGDASYGGYAGINAPFLGGMPGIMSPTPAGTVYLPGMQTGGISRLAASADGTKAITLLGSGSMRVWDVATGLPLDTYRRLANTAAMSADGWLAASGFGRNLSLWDTKRGLEIARRWLDGDIKSLAFLPNGRYLVTMTHQTIKVWAVHADIRASVSTSGESERARNQDCQEQATRQLDSAKTLLENNSRDAAMTRLWDIVEHYPMSPEAVEAKKLLASTP